jgi:hypothetical protein
MARFTPQQEASIPFSPNINANRLRDPPKVLCCTISGKEHCENSAHGPSSAPGRLSQLAEKLSPVSASSVPARLSHLAEKLSSVPGQLFNGTEFFYQRPTVTARAETTTPKSRHGQVHPTARSLLPLAPHHQRESIPGPPESTVLGHFGKSTPPTPSMALFRKLLHRSIKLAKACWL